MQIKKLGASMIGLLVVLIALMFFLNLAKKLPVVGKVAAGAQELATAGHL